MALNSHDYRGTLGYWIARECRHGLEELELQRLELITDPDNRASQRVAEKVGFHARICAIRTGPIRDSVMFSLLPGELRE